MIAIDLQCIRTKSEERQYYLRRQCALLSQFQSLDAWKAHACALSPRSFRP